MTPQIAWLRVFVEGVVIVGSILLAFGIDAWWEGVGEREEEQEILTGLRTDFQANLAEFERIFRLHSRWEGLAVHLDSMAGRDISFPPDSIGVYLAAFTGRATFEAQDGTLDAIIASGSLGLLRDNDLRDQLVSWKSGVEDVGEEATSYWSAGERVIHRLGELGGPWRQFDPRAPWSLVPELVEESKSLPSADLAEVIADAELMDLLRTRRFLSIAYRGQLSILVEHAARVLAIVETNLQ